MSDFLNNLVARALGRADVLRPPSTLFDLLPENTPDADPIAETREAPAVEQAIGQGEAHPLADRGLSPKPRLARAAVEGVHPPLATEIISDDVPAVESEGRAAPPGWVSSQLSVTHPVNARTTARHENAPPASTAGNGVPSTGERLPGASVEPASEHLSQAAGPRRKPPAHVPTARVTSLRPSRHVDNNSSTTPDNSVSPLHDEPALRATVSKSPPPATAKSLSEVLNGLTEQSTTVEPGVSVRPQTAIRTPAPAAPAPVESPPTDVAAVESEPRITVTIGRVDIRALVTRQPGPPPARTDSAAALHDYLRGSSRGGNR
jgi:hypothetical protein